MLNPTLTVVTYVKHLKEKGVEVDKDDLTATVKAVRNAMERYCSWSHGCHVVD